MASATSPPLLHAVTSLRHRTHNARPTRTVCCNAHASKPALASLANRRQLLLSLTATSFIIAGEKSPSLAEDIPLFGLRKKLQSAEEEAVEIVREGFETAEKGLETAEKGIKTVERGIVTAEKGIETAEREIENAVSFGGLAQAGAVAGAEFVGVLVATTVVNGILGPEAQKP